MSDNHMQDVCDLLEYVGLQEEDLETVYYKIHFWSFVISLADQLQTSGSLSTKQKTALVDLIKKHTGAICITTDISHEAKYSRAGTRTATNREEVKHEFFGLKDIQLYDLPFEHDSVQELEFHPYNRHSTVVRLRGKYYKIPLPTKWSKLTKSEIIKFRYRRTACKGYMEKLP